MSRRMGNSRTALASAVLGGVLLLASACGGEAAPTATAVPATAAPQSGTAGGNMDALVAAAKQEGQLTVIALPHDWCGYGDLITNFKTKYGLQVNELNPDAGSGDEVQAIKANKDNK